MANVKFTDLAPVVSLDGTELLAVVQPGNSSGTSKSATTQQIADLVNDPAIAATYVLLSPSAVLHESRTLTGSSNVTLTDAGPGTTVTLNLSDTGVTATTYGDASHVAQFALDAKGRISSASNVAISVAAASIVVGTTAVASGTTTRVLYDNAGVLGEYPISGTGNVAMTTSPSFTTPALGTPSAVVLTSGTGLPISSGLTGAGTGVLTALGVNVGSAGSPVVNGGALGTPSSGTLTSVTGLPLTTGVTGVLPSANGGTGVNNSASTITLGGSLTTSGAFASTFTMTGITGVTFPTSGTLATTASPSASITVGTTTITGGSGGNVLYNKAGTLGEMTTTGSGTVLALATSPSFTTPILGTPTSGTLTNCTGYTIANVSGLGTGIATALGINTGSAGAPVLFNGAGGTPSSITLTNATGLPIAGTTGYGTGVATALAVNVGSAGAFVTFNGAGGTPSSLTLTNATGLPVAGGGTGRATLTNHGVLVGAATTAITQLAAAGAGTLLGGVASSDPAFTSTPVLGLSGTTGTLGFSGTSSGTVTVQPQSAAGTYNFNLPTTAGSSGDILTSAAGGSSPMTWTTKLPVANGGTGQATLTNHALLVGATTSAITQLAVASTGTILQGATGADPAFSATPTIGNATTTGAALLTGKTSGVVTLSVVDAAGTWTMKLPTSAGSNTNVLQTDGSGNTSWVAVSGSGTVNSGTAGQMAYYASSTTAVSGNANATISAGALTLGVATSVIGTLALAGNTSGTVSIKPQAAAGTYNFNLPITAGTSGDILTSAGGVAAAMTWTTTLPVANGGSGAGTFTTGGILIGNGTSAFTAVGTATAGLGLVSVANAAPTWQNNGIRAHISFNGTGTPANRGTPYNVTSITDNGVGDWTLNFTSNLPSANYTFAIDAQNVGAAIIVMNQFATTAPSASAIRIIARDTTTAAQDPAIVALTCIGG